MAFARILLTVGALATVLQRAIAQGRFGEDVILGEDFKMYGADVRKADINGDGQLDRAETFILVKTAHARRFAKIEAAAHLDAFKRIDDDAKVYETPLTPQCFLFVERTGARR